MSYCKRNFQTSRYIQPFSLVVTLTFLYLRPRKKYCLFPVTIRKKNSIGRLVNLFFFDYFFGQKCVFYACFTLIGSREGRKKFKQGIFLNKNLLG